MITVKEMADKIESAFRLWKCWPEDAALAERARRACELGAVEVMHAEADQWAERIEEISVHRVKE